MLFPGMIDNLIESGWEVLQSEFEPRAFTNWKMRAFQWLYAVMGPDHPYTEYFNTFVTRPQYTDLLAGQRILNAVREQMARPRRIGSPDRHPCRVSLLLPSGSADAA